MSSKFQPNNELGVPGFFKRFLWGIQLSRVLSDNSGNQLNKNQIVIIPDIRGIPSNKPLFFDIAKQGWFVADHFFSKTSFLELFRSNRATSFSKIFLQSLEYRWYSFLSTSRNNFKVLHINVTRKKQLHKLKLSRYWNGYIDIGNTLRVCVGCFPKAIYQLEFALNVLSMYSKSRRFIVYPNNTLIKTTRYCSILC